MPKLYLPNQLGFSSFLKKNVLDKTVEKLQSIGFDVMEPFAINYSKVPKIESNNTVQEWKDKNLVFTKEAGVDNFRMSEDAEVCAAILDGSHDCDSGTCIELGFIAALGKARIFALRTDIRGGEPGSPVNLQVVAAINRSGGKLCSSEEEWYAELEKEYQRLT